MTGDQEDGQLQSTSHVGLHREADTYGPYVFKEKAPPSTALKDNIELDYVRRQ